MLCLSADSFVVQRDCPPGYSVIAGYPWFNDWGRDTLIALPGLSLATGRPHIAKSILLTFAAHLKSGLIPNCFGDDGTPSYNSIDAALWFVIALYRYLAATRDLELVGHLYPRLLEIISAFTHGTAYGIKTEDDGLISGGSPDTALTWMDAKAGDWVVTPRRGKAVEINALWFNSLMIMGVFGRKLNLGQDWRIQARRVKASFRRTFWNPGARCCYDVVSDQGRDATVRPNQIFSLSLPFALFGPREALDILTAVETHLLTPYGLRSLSPRDARYQPRYGGTLLQRDGAYHQGTVWAYLLGEYLKAGLKFRPGSLTRWRRALQPLLRHLEEAGLGSISEIFDGDPPHHPRGCIAQAWSVAEVLETLQLLKSPGKNAAGRRDKTNRAEVNTGSHK